MFVSMSLSDSPLRYYLTPSSWVRSILRHLEIHNYKFRHFHNKKHCHMYNSTDQYNAFKPKVTDSGEQTTLYKYFLKYYKIGGISAVQSSVIFIHRSDRIDMITGKRTHLICSGSNVTARLTKSSTAPENDTASTAPVTFLGLQGYVLWLLLYKHESWTLTTT